MKKTVISIAAVAIPCALAIGYLRFGARPDIEQGGEHPAVGRSDRKVESRSSGEPIGNREVADVPGGDRGLTPQDRRGLAERQKREAEGFKAIEIGLSKVAVGSEGGGGIRYPDGNTESANRDGSLILERREESYYVKDVEKGSALKLPFEYGLDPENGLLGEDGISWQWLDERRIVGVQEAWRESDPNPLALPEFLSSGLSETEIAVAMPTRSFLFVYDTRVAGVIYGITLPPVPEGYAVRLDAILPGGVIELSACTPLGYHGVVGEAQDGGSRRHPTIPLGQFRVGNRPGQ